MVQSQNSIPATQVLTPDQGNNKTKTHLDHKCAFNELDSQGVQYKKTCLRVKVKLVANILLCSC